MIRAKVSMRQFNAVTPVFKVGDVISYMGYSTKTAMKILSLGSSGYLVQIVKVGDDGNWTVGQQATLQYDSQSYYAKYTGTIDGGGGGGGNGGGSSGLSTTSIIVIVAIVGLVLVGGNLFKR